jgi:hypothetical protein
MGTSQLLFPLEFVFCKVCFVLLDGLGGRRCFTQSNEETIIYFSYLLPTSLLNAGYFSVVLMIV